MGYEIIKQVRPSCSKGAAVAIGIVAAMLFATAIVFGYLIVIGRGSNYVLGTLFANEFFLIGLEVVLYGRYFTSFRQVSEAREDEFLW